jgi:hypothetical protein
MPVESDEIFSHWGSEFCQNELSLPDRPFYFFEKKKITQKVIIRYTYSPKAELNRFLKGFIRTILFGGTFLGIGLYTECLVLKILGNNGCKIIIEFRCYEFLRGFIWLFISIDLNSSKACLNNPLHFTSNIENTVQYGIKTKYHSEYSRWI